MKKIILLITLFFLLVCGEQQKTTQNWTHFVRISGHGLSLDQARSN